MRMGSANDRFLANRLPFRPVRRAGAMALAAALVVSMPMSANPASAETAQSEPRTTPAAPFISHSDKMSLSPADTARPETVDPSRATLAPPPAEAVDVEQVDIAARKTVILSSESTWEKGFESLAAAFRTLDEVVMAAGFDVRGRPFSVFTNTDDAGFRFDAMLPVSTPDNDDEAREALEQALSEHVAARTDKTLPAPQVRFGVSPSGKAIRFVHAAPYDDIDTVYEAITAYLDSKNVVVQDAFIEEYVTDLTDPTDESLEVYIYVQPKESPVRQGSPPAGTAEEPPIQELPVHE